MAFGVGGTYVAVPAQVGVGAAWTKIAEVILGGAQNNIDFPGIATGYKHFMLVLQNSGTTTGAGTNFGLRFNNDGGANYTIDQIKGVGATLSGSAGSNDKFVLADASNLPCNGVVFINNSTVNPSYKTVTSTMTTGTIIQLCGGYWSTNTTEVNRLTLVTSDTFIAGSKAILYGC